MTEPSQKPEPSQKGRSPNYPGIDLATAIAHAQAVYDKVGRNAASTDVIKSYWGYKNPHSGTASVHFAAMTKFGLMETTGAATKRQAKLTNLGLRVLHGPEPDRHAAIQEAALLPKLHTELWQQYGGHLPDNLALRSYLIIHKGFSDSGADEFIREFKSTVAFANLESRGNISPPDADKDSNGNGETDPMQTQTQPQTGAGAGAPPLVVSTAQGQDFKIILTPETLGVRVEAHRELTMREWKKLEKMLLSIRPDEADEE